jgi:hypothetical protein
MIDQSKWPAAAVEFRQLTDLIPYVNNARTHSDAQIDQLAESMREWGWTNPVLIDEKGMIIAGHGRVLAAQKLGLTEAAVMIARDWTDEQKQAYVIADNQLALNAVWDMNKLALEVSELQGMTFDISKLGFTPSEIDQMMAPPFDSEKAWHGMPNFDLVDKEAFHTVKVHFKDQESIDAFAKLVEQSVTDRTSYIWFPKSALDANTNKGRAYINADA